MMAVLADEILTDQKEIERRFAGAAFLAGSYSSETLLENCGQLDPKYLTDKEIRKFWRGVLDHEDVHRAASDVSPKFFADLSGWTNDVTSFDAPSLARLVLERYYLYQQSVLHGKFFNAIKSGDVEKVKAIAEDIAGVPSFSVDGKGAALDFSTWAEGKALIGDFEWIWPGWLARGFLHICAASQERGKSALGLWMARSFTESLPFPDGTPSNVEPGLVLWLETEAAQAVNLNRADEWGVDVSRIITPFEDPLEDWSFTNLEHREAARALAFKPEVRLVILDSLTGATGLSEKDDRLRAVSSWMAEIARDRQIPVLMTHHLRKRSLLDVGEALTLERVRGSSTITQFSRVVLGIDCPSPEEPEHRRLLQIKNSFSLKADPIGFHISSAGLEFDEPPQEPQRETILDQACNLIVALLMSGPVQVDEIKDEFQSVGISPATMNRAKKKLRVVSLKKGTSWMWALPPYQQPMEGVH